MLVVGVAGYGYLILERRRKIVPKPVSEFSSQIQTDKTLRFLIVGDTGTGDTKQYEVAHAMEQICLQGDSLDGILLLGDNFYSIGVSSTDDEQWQTKVNIPYGSTCLSKAPIYPVLGNHDYKQNPQAQVDYSLISKRWHMPHRFYSVSFSDILLLVAFDSSYPDLCFDANECSVNFLKQQLQDQTHAWRIVIAHHPLSSASKHGFGYSGGLMGTLLRPLVCNRTDAWFSGHSHHLEHRKLASCSADLFVVGGGGGDLYPINISDKETKFGKSEFGFVQLLIDKMVMEITFYNEHALQLYKTRRIANSHSNNS